MGTLGRVCAWFYLLGLIPVLGYGLSQGSLFAGYDLAVVAYAYHPIVIGLAVGLTGVANSFLGIASADSEVHDTQGQQAPTSAQSEEDDDEPGPLDLFQDDEIFDDPDEPSPEDVDYVTGEVYGYW